MKLFLTLIITFEIIWGIRNFDLIDYRRSKLERGLYYKSDNQVNFIQKGSRLIAPLVKYILYGSNGRFYSNFDVNYNIVDEDLEK